VITGVTIASFTCCLNCFAQNVTLIPKISFNTNEKELCYGMECCIFYVHVVVQFYPWFNFYFPLFLFLCYCMIMNMRQGKIKIEPRIKLNYNIHIEACQNSLTLSFFETIQLNILTPIFSDITCLSSG